MSLVQQPLTLQFNGSGPQTQRNPDGSTVDDSGDVTQAIVTTPVRGPAVPVDAAGVALDSTVRVLSPYSITMPPYGR